MKSERSTRKTSVTDTGAAVDPLSIVYAHESEKSFQARVVKAAEALGWLVQHQRISIGSAAGWPDLALVRRERLMFFEAKTERGHVTARQQQWLDALSATGVVALVIRPSNWDEIIELLR